MSESSSAREASSAVSSRTLPDELCAVSRAAVGVSKMVLLSGRRSAYQVGRGMAADSRSGPESSMKTRANQAQQKQTPPAAVGADFQCRTDCRLPNPHSGSYRLGWVIVCAAASARAWTSSDEKTWACRGSTGWAHNRAASQTSRE